MDLEKRTVGMEEECSELVANVLWNRNIMQHWDILAGMMTLAFCSLAHSFHEKVAKTYFC